MAVVAVSLLKEGKRGEKYKVTNTQIKRKVLQNTVSIVSQRQPIPQNRRSCSRLAITEEALPISAAKTFVQPPM